MSTFSFNQVFSEIYQHYTISYKRRWNESIEEVLKDHIPNGIEVFLETDPVIRGGDLLEFIDNILDKTSFELLSDTFRNILIPLCIRVDKEELIPKIIQRYWMDRKYSGLIDMCLELGQITDLEEIFIDQEIHDNFTERPSFRLMQLCENFFIKEE